MGLVTRRWFGRSVFVAACVLSLPACTAAPVAGPPASPTPGAASASVSSVSTSPLSRTVGASSVVAPGTRSSTDPSTSAISVGTGATSSPGTSAPSSQPSSSTSQPPGPAEPALSSPRFPFTDAVREHLTVTTADDADEDGKPDVVAFDVVRPRTDEKVPVIATESPYYGGSGRGAEGEDKVIDKDGLVQSMPLFYDNYFVPRGYAVVAIDAPGTGRSTGCMDFYGPRSVRATRSVLAFLSGAAGARDRQGRTVRATWSSGAVGMIGKSADGSFPLGAAASGDPALKAVVSIAGIVDGYRVLDTMGAGEPFEFAGTGTADGSATPHGGCTASDRQLTQQANAGDTPDAPFWSARTHLPVAGRWTAATLMVSGQRDDVVPADQAAELWAALGRAGAPRSWWLHQGAHDDPFDIDRAAWVTAVHRWFDHYLLGHNDIAVGTGVRVQDGDLTWHQQSAFPATGSRPQQWAVGSTLTPGSGAQGGDIRTLARVTTYQTTTGAVDTDPFYRQPTIPLRNRFVALSAPLQRPLTISGSPTLRVQVRAEGATVPVVVGLVVVGRAPRAVPATQGDVHDARPVAGQDCWGESRRVTLASGKVIVDDACYRRQAIVRAVIPADKLARAGHGGVAPSTGWVTVELTMTPVDQVIAPGERLAVTIATNDPVTSPGQQGTLVIGSSSLMLPAS